MSAMHSLEALSHRKQRLRFSIRVALSLKLRPAQSRRIRAVELAPADAAVRA
jgi:hypothetical protein